MPPTINVDTLFSPSSLWLRRLPVVHFNQGRRVGQRQRDHWNEVLPLYDKILNYWFPPTEGYDISEIGPNNQHADRLYAISAIGKKWRACYSFKGNGSKGGQPVKGVAEDNSLRSPEPQCWNADITSNDSYVAFQRKLRAMLLSDVSFSCIFIDCMFSE